MSISHHELDIMKKNFWSPPTTPTLPAFPHLEFLSPQGRKIKQIPLPSIKIYPEFNHSRPPSLLYCLIQADILFGLCQQLAVWASVLVLSHPPQSSNKTGNTNHSTTSLSPETPVESCLSERSSQLPQVSGSPVFPAIFLHAPNNYIGLNIMSNLLKTITHKAS